MISLITIITSTPANSKQLLKLLTHCFNNFVNKDIEWIVVDDGKESIKDVIPNDERIKYYHFDEESIAKLYTSLCDAIKEKRKTDKKIKLMIRKPFINIPVGMKRNLACSYASGDVIINFEPNCYYFADYPDFIMSKLDSKIASCITTEGMGHFNTKKYISVMTKQPERTSGLRRYCIPLIAMTRKYWESRKFDNQSIENEYDGFFSKRNITLYDYLQSKNVIRLYSEYSAIFDKIEPNGWHFKELSETEYLFIIDNC